MEYGITGSVVRFAWSDVSFSDGLFVIFAAVVVILIPLIEFCFMRISKGIERAVFKK